MQSVLPFRAPILRDMIASTWFDPHGEDGSTIDGPGGIIP
jgi:hypothetical protein